MLRAGVAPVRSAWRCARRFIRACSDPAGATSSSGRTSSLRHPHKIHIGSNVVVDDNCLLDAKGETQSRHHDRQRRLHRPEHDLLVQERRHRVGRRREHRLQLRDLLREPRQHRRRRADGGVQLYDRRRSRLLGSVEARARAGPDLGWRDDRRRRLDRRRREDSRRRHDRRRTPSSALAPVRVRDDVPASRRCGRDSRARVVVDARNTAYNS